MTVQNRTYSFISPHLSQTISDNYQRNCKTSFRELQRASYQASTDGFASKIDLDYGTTDAYTYPGFPEPCSIPSPIEIWDATNSKLGQPPVLLGNKINQLKDLSAQTNYKNIQKTDAFYRKNYNTPPINKGNNLIRSFIYHPQAFNNAFYDAGTCSIYYGDTDPKIFTSLIDNPEITTHELGHAITDFSSGLLYQGQSGALNESLSDVFAIAHKHYEGKKSAGSPADPYPQV